MGMRVHGEHIHIHRQLECIGDDEVLLAGRNVEGLICVEPDENHGRSGRRLRVEVKADAGLHRLRLPRRHQVQLQDEISARLQQPASALISRNRQHAWRPSQDVPVRRLRVAHVHALEAGLGVAFIATA